MKKPITTIALLVLSLAAAKASLLFTLADTDDLALSHTDADPAASPPVAGTSGVGTGTFSWGSLATDGSGNTATFSSGAFTSTDWGGQGTFTSDPIDVSGWLTVDLAGQYDGSFNTGSEFSNFFYQLDGGSAVVFGEGVEDATATNASVGMIGLDVSGATSLIVGFDFRHNGGSDFFNVDSLTATGTTGVSAIPETSTALPLAALLTLSAFRRRK